MRGQKRVPAGSVAGVISLIRTTHADRQWAGELGGLAHWGQSPADDLEQFMWTANRFYLKEYDMASDIILDEESIRFEGPTFDMHGNTLILDYTIPRDAALNTDDLRRPLVHDVGDTLTINWREKYTGGVTVMGAVAMRGAMSVNGKLSVRIRPDPPPPPAAGGMHRTGGGAGNPLDDAQPAPDDTRVTGFYDPFEHLGTTDPMVDVAMEIRVVRQLLLALNDRLKALESRVTP